MKPAVLRTKIEHAQQQLATGESELEQALRAVDQAPREDKTIIGSALSNALGVMKAARQDLLVLEQVIAEDD